MCLRVAGAGEKVEVAMAMEGGALEREGSAGTEEGVEVATDERKPMEEWD